MKFKLLLLGSLLSTGTLNASVSITDFIKARAPPRLPANCVKADQNNQCITCVDGYEVVKEGCAKIFVPPADFEPSEDFVPCGSQASCGEAKSFNTDQ